jgi:murein DD-endopeptidase MepM/ murein hydrolase activator NlpD
VLVYPRYPNRRGRLLPAYLVMVCTVVLGLAVGGPAQADPRDDAKAAERAVDRAAAVLEDATSRARNAAKQLAAATSALPGAQRRVAEARGRVASARAVATTARRKADRAEANYQVVANRFELAQRRVDEARERVDRVVAATYKGSGIAALNIIVDATGPMDAMNRIGYVDRVMEQQQADVDELSVARREARIAQDRSGLIKRTAEEAEKEAVAALARADAARTEAERARAAVLRLTRSRTQALAVARNERAATLAKYRALRAEEARLSASLRSWESRNSGSATTMRVGGKLLTPVRGWTSSGFGMRLNPVHHVWRLHAGIDFAAGHGAPIRAAAAGRVVTAGYSGGYGNFTCISHGRYGGRGLSTCYGHQSHIGVRVGERVRRGEVIGRVGTTGASTGNHLHFEVRIGGSPRNPVNYLPSCLC